MITFELQRQNPQIFVFFIALILVELTVDHCQNTKQSRAIFQDFYLWTITFGSSIHNGSTENFEIMFFGYLTKNLSLEFQGLRPLCLASKKSHVYPANQVHLIAKIIFFCFTCNVPFTKLNSPGLKHWSTMFLLRYSENITSKFSAGPFGMSVRKSPFSGIKIRKDCAWLFLSFDNGQKLL